MTFLPILQRELIEASRRRGTYWIRVGAAAAGLLIGIWIMAFPENRAPSSMGMTLFIWLSIVALVYSAFIGIFLTADCLSEEKREGTLGLLFLTDLKGYDIVAGKLAATSMNAAYGLLALFPVMAVPLLAGGVTFVEFGRMVLVCLNTLFFTHAVGMFSSAINRDERRAMVCASVIILFFVVGLPIISAIVEDTARWRNTGLAEWIAVPSPMTPAMCGVPASNFHGNWLKVVPLKDTDRIMSPPPCQGGMCSSTSCLPKSAPMPVGPNTLWPEKT